MSHANISRDPRVKKPQIVHVLSDDEDDAPALGKALAMNMNEVIDLDSESDTEGLDNAFKQMESNRTEDNGLALNFKTVKDISLGGYIKQDQGIQMDKGEHDGLDEHGKSMGFDEGDEYSMMEEDTESEEFEQDYDYEADYLLGGPLETYQYQLENRSTQAEYHPSAAKRPRIDKPDEITNSELDCIMRQVAMYTSRGEPVQWREVANGSVVDMALKTSTMKLAIANVATQDSYNRKGNLFLCDLDKGISRKLEGHTRFDQLLNQEMEVTVNDIKLSNSQNFFISGSDDHKTMIWNAETGALMNTIGEHTSRVTRVAIIEHAKDGQDVFATGSADGTLKIYALDKEGLISVGNGALTRQGYGGRRCISSISFGYHHFWDCLAVGFEGSDDGDGGGIRQGLIAIYDANTIQKVMDGDLNYRHGAQRATEKSVSCLSFSSSGSQLVCGTSGRACVDYDEKGDKMLRVIDLQTSKVVESAESGHEDVNLVDFSPCMRYLISGANTNETVVFDRRNLKNVLHRLCHSTRNDEQGHAGISSALWWPSSRGTSQSMLITGGGDETVRLWDLRRATEDTEIWNLDTNIGPIARMIAPPSMEQLIIGSDTGAIKIYSIDDGMVAKYKDKGMTLLNDDEV
ncbi:hypothetical protein EC991_002635 [Linnemannia zychae]|nr:hypothetical protein EC991_002635 [Linnemannia zychae]